MRKLLAFVLFIALAQSAHAACGSTITAGNIATSTGVDLTVTLPAHQTNDILLILGWVRDVDDTLTLTGWTQIATWDRSTTARYWLYGLRASSGSVTNPTFDKSGTTGDTYALAIGIRGCITTGTAWEVVGSGQSGTADPASLTGITSLSANSLIVVALGGEDNNNATVTTTGTDPAAYSELYDESPTGADGMIAFSTERRTTAGATGTISVDFDTAVPVGWGAVVIALKSPQCIPGELAMAGAGTC
jgi:hypothetical protein